MIVVETASVHPSDHPYERAPLAVDCAEGWAAIARACRPALVLASLGHTGSQGSTAYTRDALWGASAVADPGTREVPAMMGTAEIAALVAGFAAAARSAVGPLPVEPGVGSQGPAGDLAPANARLVRAGVERAVLSRLVEARRGVAVLEHVWTGARREMPCSLVVDAGHRLPDDTLARQRRDLPRAGDCVAPRTVHEAVREGRRAALRC